MRSSKKSTRSSEHGYAPPLFTAPLHRCLPIDPRDAVGHSSSPAKDGLRHARNEQHINDERDENHRARDQIRKPHLHRIVAVEGLLDEAIHESGPHEDEGSGNGANHGEADEHIQEVEELRSEGSGHQQWNEDRPEERRHSVQDEGAAVDEEEDRGRESEKYLHEEVAEDLNRRGEGRHCRIVTGGLEELQQGSSEF